MVAPVLATSFLSSFGASLGKSVLGSDPAGPSNATSGNFGGGIDGAGFVVNFGTQLGSGNPSKMGADASGVPSLATAGIGSGLGSGALLAVIAVVAVVYFVKKKRGR